MFFRWWISAKSPSCTTIPWEGKTMRHAEPCCKFKLLLLYFGHLDLISYICNHEKRHSGWIIVTFFQGIPERGKQGQEGQRDWYLRMGSAQQRAPCKSPQEDSRGNTGQIWAFSWTFTRKMSCLSSKTGEEQQLFEFLQCHMTTSRGHTIFSFYCRYPRWFTAGINVKLFSRTDDYHKFYPVVKSEATPESWYLLYAVFVSVTFALFLFRKSHNRWMVATVECLRANMQNTSPKKSQSNLHR